MRGRRRILYHDHMVDMLRERIGREEADVLLHDGGHRGDAHREAIGRALDAHMSQRTEGGDHIAYAVIEGRQPTWVGAELQLLEHLPETIQAAIVGHRLGEIVTGTGADDHVITGAGPRQKGTRIFIQTELVDARSFRLPWRRRIAGPARRINRSLRATWHDMFVDRTRSRAPEVVDLLLQAGIAAGCVLGIVVTTVALPRREGIPGAMIGLASLPALLWMTSGIITSLTTDVRRWLAKRANRT